jgi:tetratricopeptide (TPR) repeat protein
MAETVGGSTGQPAGHDPIRALLRAGKNDQAIVQLCAILVTRTDDVVARELLFEAFYNKRDWAPALVLAEQLVAGQPEVARLQKALIATLSNMRRFDEAIAQATHYIEKHGEDLTVLDALKVANFYTGKTNEAIRHGQRALGLRDLEACRNPPPSALTQPAGPPRGNNVISFSLWGPALFYSYGAMINLVLSPHRLSGLELPVLYR